MLGGLPKLHPVVENTTGKDFLQKGSQSFFGILLQVWRKSRLKRSKEKSSLMQRLYLSKKWPYSFFFKCHPFKSICHLWHCRSTKCPESRNLAELLRQTLTPPTTPHPGFNEFLLFLVRFWRPCDVPRNYSQLVLGPKQVQDVLTQQGLDPNFVEAQRRRFREWWAWKVWKLLRHPCFFCI